MAEEMLKEHTKQSPGQGMHPRKTPDSGSMFELAGHALSHGAVSRVTGKGPGPAHKMKEMHVAEAHSGGYIVHKHHGDGQMTQHISHDLDGVHDHLEEHMGEPNEGEAVKDAATGEHAGGSDGGVQSKPDGGQGEGGIPPKEEK